MPHSPGLMLHLGWEVVWSSHGSGLGSLSTFSWHSLDFLEGNTLEIKGIKPGILCLRSDGRQRSALCSGCPGGHHSQVAFMILEGFSQLSAAVVTELEGTLESLLCAVLCCSHRCHLPAGGGLGPEAAAPHSDHPREQLQEVTQEGQRALGSGWAGGRARPGQGEGSSKLTKYKQ